MNEATLISHYPQLFHMAESGSWPNIQAQGLWSTSGLLDLYRVDGAERAAIETMHRRESVTIRRGGLPDAVVRDQKPMSDGALRKCLQDGLSPTDWYRILNGKVFFWATRARLIRLLKGRAYRGQSHDVLTIDTRGLVGAYRNKITLCPYNSGSTIFNPVNRGLGTFLPINDYPFDAWRRTRGRDAVVEVVVEAGVPNISDYVLKVESMKDGITERIIWEMEEQ